MVRLSDLGEFRRLSASLSYLLMAASGSSQRLLDLIVDRRSLEPHERDVAVELIDYVLNAWEGSRRRLGPAAALHPLRATALLVKTLPEVSTIDLAVTLLHDKVEDVTPATRPEARWRQLESDFLRLEGRLDPEGRWDLNARLRALSRLESTEDYCAYLGRLLAYGRRRPDVVRAKLTDRLDNTLDFSIDFRDPLEEVDFFEQVFQCLTMPEWPGPPEGTTPTASSRVELSWRLYSLYKNVVLLSLLRSTGAGRDDGPCATLADELVEASFKEAQRIALELLADEHGILPDARELLRSAMHYAYAGFAYRVTVPDAGHVIDGLLVTTFDTRDRDQRVQRLETLASDVQRLFEGAVTFVAIFGAFRRDPTFVVRGIDPGGVHPAE